MKYAIFFLLSFTISYGQTYKDNYSDSQSATNELKIVKKKTCSDMIAFVKHKGYLKDRLDGDELNSKRVHTIETYYLDQSNYVVIELTEDAHDFTTSKYIYCDVPEAYWKVFRWGGHTTSISYIQRFSDYILKFKCDCN